VLVASAATAIPDATITPAATMVAVVMPAAELPTAPAPTAAPATLLTTVEAELAPRALASWISSPAKAKPLNDAPTSAAINNFFILISLYPFVKIPFVKIGLTLADKNS
jgi:hypothetical protein